MVLAATSWCQAFNPLYSYGTDETDVMNTLSTHSNQTNLEEILMAKEKAKRYRKNQRRTAELEDSLKSRMNSVTLAFKE